MQIEFTQKIQTSARVLGVAQGCQPTTTVQGISGFSELLNHYPRFSGKREQTLALTVEGNPLLLVGLGELASFDEPAARRLGGVIFNELDKLGISAATVDLAAVENRNALAVQLALGANLRSYRFDKYKKVDEDARPMLEVLHLLVDDEISAKNLYIPLDAQLKGVFTARDLVSEPANVLYPESYAERCLFLKELGVEVEILDANHLSDLGMNSLLSVAQGSQREARVVVMQWKNGGATPPLAFVGKGVTFDTGGISIKPAAGMEDMKWDMAGSATVVGLMETLARRKAPVNAVGVIGLVENMPSGSASRPGDVVKAMSGQTIEILNTDAEGRLVLADALWYTQDRFKPRLMIDLATLTGAIIVALGVHKAGMFCNDDTLQTQLLKASKRSGESLWPMPLGDEYVKEIKSEIADWRNITSGKGAGSTIGAVFLQQFVNGVPWAHLDVAGVVWADKEQPLFRKGATGFGVRLLDELVSELTA